MGAFLDIEGAFDNTSFNAITTAVREHGLEETCCRWIESTLENRLVRTFLMGSSLTARVVGGCPQCRVLSPLLWNLVADRLLVIINDLGFSTYGYADNIAGEVKYLGVTLDSKLNWNQHLQKIIRKGQTTLVVVRHMCGKKWGLRPNMVHWLYTGVIRPYIFHGALVWWPKVMQRTTKTQLGRIQRMACLAFTGAMK